MFNNVLWNTHAPGVEVFSVRLNTAARISGPKILKSNFSGSSKQSTVKESPGPRFY